ncbi:hypothetical protein HAZT_HAZT003572, partial [Hyalella azteca]
MDLYTYIICEQSGACAGLATDVLLFPLDTLKTRMQSRQGFNASGGFCNIYAGLGPAALASAPGAALFFCSYETVKAQLGTSLSPQYQPLVQMVAAGVGEMTACLIRVPTEIVKQRRQAQQHSSALHIARSTLKLEGPAGLYRGYFTTLAREIPFSLIQFPLWEGLKVLWATRQGRPIESWQAAVCGAFAGGISAAVTTPLDVAKTRIMLAAAGTPQASGKLPLALKLVVSESGIPGLFAGVVPRTLWMSIGGFIFLGVYAQASAVLSRISNTPEETQAHA